MNLKKIIVTVVAVLTAGTAFAQSQISREELIQMETQQTIGVFFQEFSQRVAEGNPTESDNLIIQTINEQVAVPVKQLGEFLVEFQNKTEYTEQELEETFTPIEDSLQFGLSMLTDTVMQALDYDKLNEEGRVQLRQTEALWVLMGAIDADTHLTYIPLSDSNIDQGIIAQSAFTTTLGYLLQKKELTEEEVLMIISLFFGDEEESAVAE